MKLLIARLLILVLMLTFIHCVLEVQPQNLEEEEDGDGNTTTEVMNDAQEQRLGIEFHTQLRRDTVQFPIYTKDTHQDTVFLNTLTSYFTDILWRVTGPTRQFPQSSILYVIKSDSIFTFTAPGAYFYISTGMLKSINDLSEFFGVIGHEIAHMTHSHFLLTIASSGLAEITLEAVKGSDSELADFVAGSFEILAGGYMSELQERKADSIGTIYLASTTHNPRGLANYLESARDTSLDYFSYNTDIDSRVSAINQLVDDTEEWHENDNEDRKKRDKWLQITALLYPDTLVNDTLAGDSLIY